MAISPNKEQIALYNNRGYVFFMTPNLDDIESRKRVNVGLNEELTSDELLEQQQIINYEEGCQFLFAGEEAVAICGNRFIILVNESIKTLFLVLASLKFVLILILFKI